MKRLFDKYEKYSEEGNQIYQEAEEALGPIFEKWSKQGYSIREISHIISGTINYVEAFKILQKAVDLRKSERRIK